MNNFIYKIHEIIKDSQNFDGLVFRANELDFIFKGVGLGQANLARILDEFGFEYEESGRIITSKTKSKIGTMVIYSSYYLISNALYNNDNLTNEVSIVVLDHEQGNYFLYNQNDNSEYYIDSTGLKESFLVQNLNHYLPLLKLFREERQLSEFDDKLKLQLLIIDNDKERNVARISYTLFDNRIFSKKVQFDFNDFKNRLIGSSQANNRDWIAIFKHNVVSLLLAQEDENKTFIELFLNVQFVLNNTIRDYEIFISGFSFERVKKELKQEKEKYFQSLNQAQEKIKSQVIAVPLSIGTSIYAFFQMHADIRTFYFILAMVGIYIVFICWYLILYDKDLYKLKRDIKGETDVFVNNYPKVYEIFRDDFIFIKKKVNSVLWLSGVIKFTIILDWIVLLIYILFVVKQPAELTHFKFVFNE